VSRGVCYGAHRSLRGACHASTAWVSLRTGAEGTLAALPDAMQGGLLARLAFRPAPSRPLLAHNQQPS
jgi:hypothetical protein